MGLIKAAGGAIGGTLADQWKEFFVCDSLDVNVLCKKGQKKVGNRSSNTKGSDNVITNGSGIIVADGQCLIIVDQGKVAEVCAEPGEYTYDISTEPSVFTGKFGASLAATFKEMGKRFTYGGEPAKDQRVYYFNMKEIIDNKFGTPTPIPFRVVDTKVDLDLDTSVKCSGVYSYKITDPIKFYTNVCGNVDDEYTREDIDSQLKTEFIDKLMPGFGALSNLEIRPNQIPAHTEELRAEVNKLLEDAWGKRGLHVESIAISTCTIPEEDQAFLQQAQRARTFSNQAMGAGLSAMATADAMNAAASNENGAMTGFMGMGMAMNTGMNQTASLYQGAAGQAPISNPQAAAPGAAAPQAAQASAGWTCSCGTTNTGNFCSNCGSKNPAAPWTCSCGTTNTGNFCNNCGSKRPE